MIKKNAKENKKLAPVEKLTVEKITYVSPDPYKTRVLFKGTVNDMVSIKSLSYVETVTDGKENHFISMPSQKGKDGRYYNTVYCYCPSVVVEDVREQIEKMLQE